MTTNEHLAALLHPPVTTATMTPEDVDSITDFVKAHSDEFPAWHEAWTLGANAISLRSGAVDLYLAAVETDWQMRQERILGY